jgi:hypothetical protein
MRGEHRRFERHQRRRQGSKTCWMSLNLEEGSQLSFNYFHYIFHNVVVACLSGMEVQMLCKVTLTRRAVDLRHAIGRASVQRRRNVADQVLVLSIHMTLIRWWGECWLGECNWVKY